MQATQFKTSDDTASLPVGYPLEIEKPKQEESAELSQSTDRLVLTSRQTGTAKRITLYHLLHLRLVLA